MELSLLSVVMALLRKFHRQLDPGLVLTPQVRQKRVHQEELR